MSNYKKRRCTATKADGERCATFCLRGENKCIWHSDSPKGIRNITKKPVLQSNKELAEILTKELNRVRKMSQKGNRLKKAQEIRKLVSLIMELSPNKTKAAVAVDGEKKVSFEEKVKKAKKRKSRK